MTLFYCQSTYANCWLSSIVLILRRCSRFKQLCLKAKFFNKPFTDKRKWFSEHELFHSTYLIRKSLIRKYSSSSVVSLFSSFNVITLHLDYFCLLNVKILALLFLLIGKNNMVIIFLVVCFWKKIFSLLLAELSSQCWWSQQSPSNRSKCAWSKKWTGAGNPTASPWQQTEAKEENNHTRGTSLHF